jgi:hypothetical protein
LSGRLLALAGGLRGLVDLLEVGRVGQRVTFGGDENTVAFDALGRDLGSSSRSSSTV